MGVSIDNLNEEKLEQLQGKVIGDVSGAMGLLLSYIGDQLDLYSALSEVSPSTSEELAASTGLPERYLREWLSANAAGGYVDYDPATTKFSMTPEQAVVFAAEGHPHCMQGFFQAVMSAYIDEPKATTAFRAGAGRGKTPGGSAERGWVHAGASRDGDADQHRARGARLVRVVDGL